MTYQPVWGDARDYQRECEDRYEPIRELAKQYKRTFSVLDLGANYGWFDFKLISEFDCTCVLVDDKPIGDLVHKYGDGRAVWLNRHLSGKELLALSRSENFDIVLALSVLHHIPDYREAFEGLMGLGAHVFLEIPGDGDVNAAGKERHEGIQALCTGHEPVAYFPSHVSKGVMRPLYLMRNHPFIEEQTLDAKERQAPTYGRYEITSDFERCTIRIDRTARPKPMPQPIEERDFVPGMNLHNFMLLGGGIPKGKHIEKAMWNRHPDNRPWNYIVGKGITPIDTVRKW